LLTSIALVMAAGVLFVGLFSAGNSNRDGLGWDFRSTYYPAGEAVVHGTSPYPEDVEARYLGRTVYAYPPTLALLVAPLTSLPVGSAAVVAMLVSFAALMGALALVGVRDVRCFAAVLLWAPAWNELEMANVSALLALLLALAWRFRAIPLALASALAVTVAIKLFLWPLLVWAAFTRRGFAAALALVVGVALTVGSWALIGFAGLRAYPVLLDRVAAQQSYALDRIGDALGLSSSVAYLTMLVVTASLTALCVTWGRRGDEERAFLAGVAAALACTPVLWLHYLVLLAVPLALLRPRFSPLWLLPIVLWASSQSDVPDGWQLLVPAAVAAAVVVALARRPTAPRVRPTDRLEGARTA
jgi:hypothetical protein